MIDEKTYQAFSEIINDKTCDSSQLQKNLEHMEQFALGNTRVTSGKNGFEAYTEYLIAKINDLNADHNFAKCADFTAASEYINNEMDSIAASCVLDYITMLTIKKMEFKVRQYENRDISGSCQKFIDNITESITKIMDSYAQAKEKSMKALQAQVMIRSNEDGTVSGCVFDGNKAGVDGGAICASCHAKLMADNTTITGNRAGCNGGGIYLGALTTSNHHLTNVTITGNSANHGGGIYCSAGAFKAADTCLHGIVNIKDNNGDNAYLVNDSGKKALLYTKGDFDRSNSTVYVSSSSRSDIAVVDLDSKSHESSFHADYGRRLYRGTMYNGTLYLDDM